MSENVHVYIMNKHFRIELKNRRYLQKLNYLLGRNIKKPILTVYTIYITLDNNALKSLTIIHRLGPLFDPDATVDRMKTMEDGGSDTNSYRTRPFHQCPLLLKLAFPGKF